MIRVRTVILAILALAVFAPTANAGYRDAIRDCSDDGQLQGNYSRSDLKKAHDRLPTDLAEYTDCEDVLRRALAASAKGGRGGGSGGGGYNPPANPALRTPSGAAATTPEDFNALDKETRGSGNSRSKAPKLAVGSREITPGTGGVLSAAASGGTKKLPQPVFWSLIGLGVMSALAGTILMRQQWPLVRRVALRILRR